MFARLNINSDYLKDRKYFKHSMDLHEDFKNLLYVHERFKF